MAGWYKISMPFVITSHRGCCSRLSETGAISDKLFMCVPRPCATPGDTRQGGEGVCAVAAQASSDNSGEQAWPGDLETTVFLDSKFRTERENGR